MNFLISENQFKIIVNEGFKPTFENNMQILSAFFLQLLNKVRKKYGINLKLLSTWGTSVAGLVMPLNDFIEKGNFQLDDSQKALILVGVAAVIFFDNKSAIQKVLSKVKEEGLESQFQEVLKKGFRLRKAFFGFMNSLQVSITSFSELISYAFLIPIVTDIYDVITHTDSIEEAVTNISSRLLASGLILVGSEVLHEVIKSMSKRFKKG